MKPSGISMDQLPCGICQVAPDESFTIVSANRYFYRMHGYTPKQAGEEGFHSMKFIIYPPDYPMVREIVRKNRDEDSGGFEMEHRTVNREGEPRWMLVRCSRDPKRDYFNCVIFDITDRKRMEEQLRLSEEINRIAFQNTDRFLCVYEIASRTLYQMGKAKEIFREEKILRNIPDGILEQGLVAEESREEYRGFFQRMAEGIPEGEAVFRVSAGGTFRWFSARYTLIFDRDNKPLRSVLSYEDITGQREKELAFRKWRQYFDSQRPNSIGYYEYNLTKNLCDASKQDLPQPLPSSIRSFTGAVRYFAGRYVYGEDREKYFAFYSRERLLMKYLAGQKTDLLEYRRKAEEGGCFWARGTVQLLQDPYSEDIKAYVLVQDIDEEKRKLLQMRERMETDELTGLLNRAAVIEKISAAVSEEGQETLSAFLMLDIDFFKQLNDAYGHQYGDRVLTDIAAAMRRLLREEDLCGRIGGDEFVIFFQDIPSESVMAERLKQLLCAMRLKYDSGADVSVSIGAVYPCRGADFEELYRRADEALYQSKGRGRNQYTLSAV